MTRLFATLWLLTVPALAVLDAQDLPAPREFVSKDGRFKANFPGKVETKVTRATSGGAPVRQTTAHPKPELVFTVGYFDLPKEIPAEQVQDTLKRMTAAGKGGKVLSEKEVAFGKDKIPARETVTGEAKVLLRVLVVIDGKRVYQVLVGGETEAEVTSKAADQFIASFRITR